MVFLVSRPLKNSVQFLAHLIFWRCCFGAKGSLAGLVEWALTGILLNAV